MIASFFKTDFTRFLVVSITGLGADLFVALSSSYFLEIALPLATILGFAAGGIVNYFLHEYWTFRSSSSRLSLKRSMLYAVSMLITLVSRVSMVAILQTFIFSVPMKDFIILICAVAFSFMVNYAVSKFLIFNRP